MARSLSANRELERRIQEALFVRLSAVMERPLSIEIGKTMIKASREYEKEGQIETAFIDHEERISRIMRPVIETTLNTFHERTLKMLPETKAFDRWINSLSMFFKVFDKGLKDIAWTTKRQIKAAIEAGQVEGSGVQEIAKDIRQVAPQLSALRAHVIARTETHKAANFANLETAINSAVPLVKIWIPTMDERTRGNDEKDQFDHTNVPGPVALTEPFDVSGEYLMYPGDPDGSAGNVINCRCAIGYEIGG
jgi:uncharacterized protein with gpF-like domain